MNNEAMVERLAQCMENRLKACLLVEFWNDVDEYDANLMILDSAPPFPHTPINISCSDQISLGEVSSQIL